MFNRLKNIFNRVNDLSDSVENYQKETDKQIIPSLAYVNRAKKLIDKGDFLEAITVLNAALEIDVKDAFIYKYLAIAYEKIGDYSNAIKLYKTSADINPQDKNIWHNLGMTLVTVRNYEEAEKAFEKADKITPINTDIQTGWGMSLFKQKKYKDAREKFLKAISINRYNFSAMLLAAISEIRLQMYDDAETKLRFLLNANPNESSAFEFANLCFTRKKYDDAIVYAEKSLDFNKQMLPAYLLLGKIYSLKFDYDNATKYFETAKDNDLESIYLYVEWGNALIRFGRYTEAKEMFQKALLEDVENEDAQAGMTFCCAETNEFEKACDLIKILEEKGNESTALLLAKGTCAMAFGEIDNALQIFKKIIGNTPEEISCYIKLAKCYYKLQKDDMVHDSYEKLIKFCPNFANGYFEYAKYLLEKEDYLNAQRKLRKGVHLEPNNQEMLNMLFYVSYKLVKDNVCEYNIKETIALANKIKEFKYPELRADLEILLKNIKENK